MIQGNNIINSSIIITIIVDGKNDTPKILNELFDDSEIHILNKDEVITTEEPQYTSATPVDYDTFSPEFNDIYRGPLRIENPEEIPLLRNLYTKEPK